MLVIFREMFQEVSSSLTCAYLRVSCPSTVWYVLKQGKAGKYTEYSSATGITKHEGQSTLHMEATADVAKELFHDPSDSSPVLALARRLPNICAAVCTFAEEREWTRYHTPRNLVLALMGEMGELAELWQFRVSP